MPPPPESASLTGDLFRQEGARLVAVLTGQLGVHNLQLAEDVVQEALVRALQTWPYRGVPENPAAWLTRTAKNLALDSLRREQRWKEKEEGIALARERWLSAPDTPDEHETFADDTLRLLFVCCHPQLSVEAQTALALRTLCGLSAGEIAAAFLSTEAAISKRLVRARQRIRELALPFAMPEPVDLPVRLDAVLHTLYLLFNEGYKASGGEHLVRDDLCREAIRLGRLLAAHPRTGQPRTHALLALMLLNAARFSARTDPAGGLLRLHEQERSTWDHSLIHDGIRRLALAGQGDALSEYHLEAGIAACHSTAPTDAATDWPRIISLYDRLAALNPSPVVALNRAVAVARVSGPRAGLDAIAAIAGRAALESYQPYHTVCGALHAALGDPAAARPHFLKARALATLPSEQAFLAARLRDCESG